MGVGVGRIYRKDLYSKRDPIETMFLSQRERGKTFLFNLFRRKEVQRGLSSQ